MADISQITLLNGDVVNLKDSAGREAAATGLAGKVNIAQGIQNQGKILKVGSGGLLELSDDAEGTGDVVGPSSAVDEHVAVFDGTTGKAIKDSGYTIGKSVPSDAAFTDTTYEVKSAAAGGIDESLVTTGEKAVWNAKTDNVGTVIGVAMNGGAAIAPDNDGVVNLGTVLTQHQDISGKADLDQSGKVPSSQLPSYVDDVLEYASMQQFPLTGESGKIYIAVDTNISYRWSGTVYVSITSDLALGETSSTAYRGDRGKTAYDHASAKGSAFASGLYKVTTNSEGHVTDATVVQKSDITGLGIPGQDTTYDPATQSDAGLMSATDKAKLDGMLSATKSNIDSALQTTSGTSKFYREDGTWAIPPGTKPYIYRGKNLGSAVTAEQWDAIDAGTFDDLYIGDCWTINGVNWRIAAFDYWYNTGEPTICTKHHIVIVPDSCIAICEMNVDGSTTGAYIGSDFYTGRNNNIGKTTAITAVNNAFGSVHILSHRELFANAVTNGYESSCTWVDSTVDLMNERMVFGSDIFHNIVNGTNIPSGYTIDNSQLPLFSYRHDIIAVIGNTAYYLRDVAGSNKFSAVAASNTIYNDTAWVTMGIRPAFGICKSNS